MAVRQRERKSNQVAKQSEILCIMIGRTVTYFLLHWVANHYETLCIAKKVSLHWQPAFFACTDIGDLNEVNSHRSQAKNTEILFEHTLYIFYCTFVFPLPRSWSKWQPAKELHSPFIPRRRSIFVAIAVARRRRRKKSRSRRAKWDLVDYPYVYLSLSLPCSHSLLSSLSLHA